MEHSIHYPVAEWQKPAEASLEITDLILDPALLLNINRHNENVSLHRLYASNALLIWRFPGFFSSRRAFGPALLIMATAPRTPLVTRSPAIRLTSLLQAHTGLVIRDSKC